MTTGRLMALAAVVVVLGALGLGLWASGSPTTQREFRLDERRVADLQGVSAAVERHYQVHRVLPDGLQALAETPGSRLSTRDPVTGEPYGYEVLDAGRYRLCANFSHDTAAAGGETFRIDAIWWHGAGRHCFDRRAEGDATE